MTKQSKRDLGDQKFFAKLGLTWSDWKRVDLDTLETYGIPSNQNVAMVTTFPEGKEGTLAYFTRANSLRNDLKGESFACNRDFVQHLVKTEQELGTNVPCILLNRKWQILDFFASAQEFQEYIKATGEPHVGTNGWGDHDVIFAGYGRPSWFKRMLDEARAQQRAKA